MKEKGVEVLDKYNLEVIRTGKVRGGIMLVTENESLIMKECHRKPERVEYENGIHQIIEDESFIDIDRIVVNRDGELISTDAFQNPFIIKKWYGTGECQPDNQIQVCMAMEHLGKIHIALKGFCGKGEVIAENLICRYEKYNRELKRARNYARRRSHKSDFELKLLNCFDRFYENCENALEMLSASSYENMYNQALMEHQIIHGDYNYHNVILSGEKGGAVINFEGACVDLNVMDVYHFLRKVMEKNSWNAELGHKMIESYNKVRSISQNEIELLKIMILYPEKFRKVVNNYYNGNKSSISVKNAEKLELVHKQMILRHKFVHFL